MIKGIKRIINYFRETGEMIWGRKSREDKIENIIFFVVIMIVGRLVNTMAVSGIIFLYIGILLFRDRDLPGAWPMSIIFFLIGLSIIAYAIMFQ